MCSFDLLGQLSCVKLSSLLSVLILIPSVNYFLSLSRSPLTQTNTFEKLHEQELLGKENIPGVDALIALLEQRLQKYAAFPRSE